MRNIQIFPLTVALYDALCNDLSVSPSPLPCCSHSDWPVPPPCPLPRPLSPLSLSPAARSASGKQWLGYVTVPPFCEKNFKQLIIRDQWKQQPSGGWTGTSLC